MAPCKHIDGVQDCLQVVCRPDLYCFGIFDGPQKGDIPPKSLASRSGALKRWSKDTLVHAEFRSSRLT